MSGPGVSDGIDCQPCTGGTFTLEIGSISGENCTECEPNFCNGRGDCAVVNSVAVCTCNDGFQLPNCLEAVPSQGLSDGARAGFAIAALVIAATAFAVLLRRYLTRRKLFHIFISYRVATDAPIAERICRELQGRTVAHKSTVYKIKCFWDQQDIEEGHDWETAFLHALKHSCLFLPLVSEAALKPIQGALDLCATVALTNIRCFRV